MTLPQLFLLIAAVLMLLRAGYGLLQIMDQRHKIGADGVPVPGEAGGLTSTVGVDTFPREWVITHSRPYDQEGDAA